MIVKILVLTASALGFWWIFWGVFCSEEATMRHFGRAAGATPTEIEAAIALSNEIAAKTHQDYGDRGWW